MSRPNTNDETAFTKSKKKRWTSSLPAEAEYPLSRWIQNPDNVTMFQQGEKGKVTRASFHPSGQVHITYPDGSVVTASPGVMTMEAEGSSVTIRGNHDVDIGGHHKTTVAGGSRTEVAGQYDLTTKGATINIMGDAAIAVNGNANIATKKNMNLDAAGNMTIQTAGTMNLGAGGGMNLQATTIAMQKGGDGASGYVKG